MAVDITRGQWFKTLTHMTETEWIKHPQRFPVKPEMGQFATYTIGQLRSMIAQQDQCDHKCDPICDRTFDWPEFIIYVRKNRETTDTYFDTSSLQLMDYDTSYPVMFQVASNFNCQENGSPMTNFRLGNYLTQLMSDSTQGPSACGGAGWGAILRLMHHLSSPINLLEQTACGDYVVEGKLYDDGVTQFTPPDVELIQIGLHTNVVANFDRSQLRHRCLYYPKGKVIDQVLTSSLIAPSSHNGPVMEHLLLAAYTGTYLSAIYRRTEVLVLTLIGGGCFNNPYKDIITALVQVHCDLSNQGHLKKVILPLYDDSRSPTLIVEQLVAKGYSKQQIKVIAK